MTMTERTSAGRAARGTRICLLATDTVRFQHKQTAPAVLSAPDGSLISLAKEVLNVTPSTVPNPQRSDNCSIPETDLCIYCHEPLIKFGTCRLYSTGWVFDLAYCKRCRTYDFQSPTRPGELAIHQAYNLRTIFAETGGRL